MPIPCFVQKKGLPLLLKYYFPCFQIQVEARLKISDKAKSGFIEEAKNFSPYTILLSCSMKKYLQKQMFG